MDDYAHVGYVLDGEFDKLGLPTLKIDTIFGSERFPKDEYFYAKIENFQSIEKLEFRYKGLTIIRGNNNIGKSASFRAINSLLFNTFDTTDYPRKKKAKGAETKIHFGYYKDQTDIAVEDRVDTSISLKYSSSKVIYEFDGMSFAGKLLSFEKVKEKVESIGFKYVNLKETYKNFKGNLKDQTERLALTTQYDGFYLVGSKSNETDKVFNFLFDSTDIANAIATISIDISTKNNEYNALLSTIDSNKRELKRSKISLEKYIAELQIIDIMLYSKIFKYSKILNSQKTLINDIILYLENMIFIIQGIQYLDYQNNSLSQLKRSTKNLFSIIDTTQSLIDLISNIRSIQDFLKLSENNLKFNNEYILLDSKIKNIDRFIIITNELELISNSMINIKTYNNLLNSKIVFQLEYNGLSKKMDNIDKLLLLSAELETYRNGITNINMYKKLLESLKKYETYRSSYNFRNAFIDTILLMLSSQNTLVVNLEQYKIVSLNLNNYQNDKKNIQEKIDHLHEECNIAFCEHCQGKGYK